MNIADRWIDQCVRPDAGGVVYDEVVYSIPVWRERWTDLMRHAGRVGAMPVMIRSGIGVCRNGSRRNGATAGRRAIGCPRR